MEDTVFPWAGKKEVLDSTPKSLNESILKNEKFQTMKNIFILTTICLFSQFQMEFLYAQCDTLIFEDTDFYALGNATIGYLNGTQNLRIANIGSSGMDGVKINLGDDGEYGLVQINYLLPLELDAETSSQLRLTVYHQAEGMDETEGSILEMQRASPQYISVSAEFPEDGLEDTLRVQIFDDGTLVGEFSTAEGIIGHLTGGIIPASARSFQGESIPGVNISLEQIPGGIIFKLDGDSQFESSNLQMFTGDQFTIEQVTCPDTNNTISSYEILASNIPDDKIDLLSISKRSARAGRNPQTGTHVFMEEGLAMGGTDRTSILTPEPGLMVYDTNTASYWFYGTTWTEFTSGGQNQMQSLSVSTIGDTLYLSNSGFVIVPGISAANYPNPVDADGNVYDTVHIADQVWLKQNLRTTKFNDCTPIQNVLDSAAWLNVGAPAYVWYEHNEEYKDPYGALYNWHVVEAGNVCPLGYRIPGQADWEALRDALGGSSVAGGKLKEAGLLHWAAPNTGATNSSGFTGLPGGSRWNGGFYNLGLAGHHWSTWSDHPTTRKVWELRYAQQLIARINAGIPNGYTIRCIKN